MKNYYIDNINTLLREEDIPEEILGFIYFCLFRFSVNKEV